MAVCHDAQGLLCSEQHSGGRGPCGWCCCRLRSRRPAGKALPEREPLQPPPLPTLLPLHLPCPLLLPPPPPLPQIPLLPDATPRLAAVDLDWGHVRAVDIFAVLRSFVPKGGAIRRVVVYPSGALCCAAGWGCCGLGDAAGCGAGAAGGRRGCLCEWVVGRWCCSAVNRRAGAILVGGGPLANPCRGVRPVTAHGATRLPHSRLQTMGCSAWLRRQ